MSKQEIIKRITLSIKEMALGDVKRAMIGKSKMGSIILGSCLMDCLATFYYGNCSTGKNYRSFVDKFLPQYDSRNFYEDLRCKLVHDYSEGGSYVFKDNKPIEHLKKYKKSNKIIINLENFVEELEKIVDDYLKLITNDDVAYKNALKRIKSLGLLGIIKD
ncbi:MAG TPA: hypothetical protein PLD14_01720 [Candidatus Pacearchaeota archaeon]|nr:hypothetical protein [Candidatus Pacearchaeota archaeon]HPR79917.1 hypothetical protein [Candidatus Pacearchaeota archaeon]